MKKAISILLILSPLQSCFNWINFSIHEGVLICMHVVNNILHDHQVIDVKLILLFIYLAASFFTILLPYFFLICFLLYFLLLFIYLSLSFFLSFILSFFTYLLIYLFSYVIYLFIELSIN